MEVVPMVESNNDEERLARIEQIIERLERQAEANSVLTGKLVIDIAALSKRPPTRRHKK
jgi:hypothetical protein